MSFIFLWNLAKIQWKIVRKKLLEKQKKNGKIENQEWLAQKTGIKTNKLSIIFNFQFKKTKKVSRILKRNFTRKMCEVRWGNEREFPKFSEFSEIYRFFVMCFFGWFLPWKWICVWYILSFFINFFFNFI